MKLKEFSPQERKCKPLKNIRLRSLSHGLEHADFECHFKSKTKYIAINTYK